MVRIFRAWPASGRRINPSIILDVGSYAAAMGQFLLQNAPPAPADDGDEEGPSDSRGRFGSVRRRCTWCPCRRNVALLRAESADRWFRRWRLDSSCSFGFSVTPASVTCCPLSVRLPTSPNAIALERRRWGPSLLIRCLWVWKFIWNEVTILGEDLLGQCYFSGHEM